MRTTFPLILTFVVGMIMLGEVFIPHWRYRVLTENILEWGIILAAAAFLLGLINLVQVNLPKVLNREQDWGYKALMLVALVATLAAGFSSGTERLAEERGVEYTVTSGESWASIAQSFDMLLPDLLELNGGDGAAVLAEPETGTSIEVITKTPTTYKWVFDFVFVPLTATMFALLAFYIASAAFRAFRARNIEATVLLVAAVIVMIGRVPIGEALSDKLPVIVNWLMEVPNTAARRAIFIGAALGAIATGLRIILGIERSHLGGE